MLCFMSCAPDGDRRGGACGKALRLNAAGQTEQLRSKRSPFPPSPFPRSGKQNQSAPCARSSAPEAKTRLLRGQPRRRQARRDLRKKVMSNAAGQTELSAEQSSPFRLRRFRGAANKINLHPVPVRLRLKQKVYILYVKISSATRRARKKKRQCAFALFGKRA